MAATHARARVDGPLAAARESSPAMRFRVTVSYPIRRQPSTDAARERACARLRALAPDGDARFAVSAITFDVALTVDADDEAQANAKANAAATRLIGRGAMRVTAQPAAVHAREA